MGRGAASDHAGLPQRTTLQHTGDPKLMLGRRTRVPDHLTYHVPAPESPVHEYVGKLVEIMGRAHDALRAKQWQIRTEDSEEPAPYTK